MLDHSGRDAFVSRAMVEGIAPPIVLAVDPDVKEPVIAFETGRDIVVVYLGLADGGYYTAEKAEWLRKVSALIWPVVR